MFLTGRPAVVDRMLLLDEVRFDPDRVFVLERPVFLRVGDRVSLLGDRLVVTRVDGLVEWPEGVLAPWCWRWRLL